MKKIIEMSREEFDKFMCEKYPIIFQDRKKPMSETCMCWGFDVGKGWYELLDNLCEKIDKLYKLTHIGIKANQVKEKFGSLRFYTSPLNNQLEQVKGDPKIDDATAKTIIDIIDDCVVAAEYKSNLTCAECGENYYEKIIIGGWVYDICEECFKKIFPGRIAGLNDCKQCNKFTKFVKDLAFDYRNKNNNLDKKLINIMDGLFDKFKKIKGENNVV
jgi:hypothetical protein